VLGGVYAFSAIQSALLHREKSGVGQSIDVSMMEAMLGMLVCEVQEAQFPQGKRRFLFTPCRASDGFLMIAPTSQRNFERFCDAIDQPSLKLDVRFTKQRIREQHWPELMEIVEQWTSTRTAKVCEEHFLRHGVPCSRYNSVGDLLDDPQALHRGTFEKIEDVAGPLRVTNPPFRFSKGRALARNKISSLGEDSDAILRSELGLNADDIRGLREAGIVG
jgi:CoA:oxalate CoA-transferase